MTSKLERCATRINDEFSFCVKRAFKEKFDRELTVEYNIFAMALVSMPADNKPFTVKQKAFVDAFDAGYTAAMGIARDAVYRDELRRAA